MNKKIALKLIALIGDLDLFEYEVDMFYDMEETSRSKRIARYIDNAIVILLTLIGVLEDTYDGNTKNGTPVEEIFPKVREMIWNGEDGIDILNALMEM